MRTLLDRSTQKAALAELIGTCLLTLTALLSSSPYAVALALAALVYAIGNTSGCHVNPAITLGLVSARRLPLATGLCYLVAQIGGAGLARGLAPRVGELASGTQAARPFAELIGAGFLMLVVAAVSDQHVPRAGSGIAIGAALAAGLVTTKGILNPAIGIAMGQTLSGATWATIAGGLLFTALFTMVAQPKAPTEEPAPGEESAASPAAPPEADAEAAAAPAQPRRRRGWFGRQQIA